MPSYAEHVAKKALTSERVLELQDWALGDARETFGEEQLAYWYHEVRVNDPPPPKQEWLRRWINDGFEEGRWPDEAEWIIYSEAYKNCLRRALYKLDHLWDDYEKAVDVSDNAEWQDVSDLENDITDECLAAMEG